MASVSQAFRIDAKQRGSWAALERTTGEAISPIALSRLVQWFGQLSPAQLSLALSVGQDARVGESLVGAAIAGRDMAASDSLCSIAIAGNNLHLTQGGGGILITGNRTEVQGSPIGLLVAGSNATLTNSTVLMTTRQAIGLGAAIGAAFAVGSVLLRRTKRLSG